MHFSVTDQRSFCLLLRTDGQRQTWQDDGSGPSWIDYPTAADGRIIGGVIFTVNRTRDGNVFGPTRNVYVPAGNGTPRVVGQ
ncbi:MAG: hypothetical protein R3A47_10165 [Polyangiales bacterium]